MSGVERRVLSEGLSERVAGRRVVAAVFTTFTFDPGFFELEVLPVLFDRSFSRIDAVRRVQLETALRETDVAVYYDRTGLVADAQPATLDFRRIDVRRRTGCFHPKVALLLTEKDVPGEGDEVLTERSLVVAALSANLTRAGWWENVEAGHVEEISDADARGVAWRDDLLRLLRMLRDVAPEEDEPKALRDVHAFLRREARRDSPTRIGARGQLHTRLFLGQKHLSKFLRELRLRRFEYHLEVVSPYLDGDGVATLKALIDDLALDEVRVMLPVDTDGMPTVTEDQYAAVAEVATWARLPEEWTRSGSKGAQDKVPPRRVHAKWFRLWRKGAGEVVVVGSANLTSAACGTSRGGNIEVSWVLDTTDAGHGARWVLEPIDREPGRFAGVAGEEREDAERVGAELSVRYDWSGGALAARLEADFAGEIELMTHTGAPVARFRPDAAEEWLDLGSEAATVVRDGLGASSVLSVRSHPTMGPTCEWRVLVREEGMANKPSLLLELSPEEILRYWSLLTPEQREQFVEVHLGEDATLQGLIAARRDRMHGADRFFAQFTTLFHAFERLQLAIERALGEGREREAEALLVGSKYDSLPVLLERLRDRELGAQTPPEERDAVMAYLAFLCGGRLVRSVAAQSPDFVAALGDPWEHLRTVLADVVALRARLDVGDDGPEFLAWFEAAFASDAGIEEVEA